MRKLLAAAAVTAIVAACNTAAPPSVAPATSAPPASTPTATPSPTPSPTPEPLGVEDIIEVVSAEDFAVEADITGTASIAGLEFDVSGEAASGPDGSRTISIIDTPGTPTYTERLRVGEDRWERNSEDGPWFEDEDDSGRDLAETLAEIEKLNDEGTIERDGQTLHRFRTDEGAVDADALGADDSELEDFAATMELLVDDEANIVVLVIDAEWEQEGQPVSMELEYDVTGSDPQFEAPAADDVWERFESERLDYTIGVPPGADTLEGTGDEPDAFGDENLEYGVGRYDLQAGTALDAFLALYAEGVQIETQDPVTIAGRPGILVTFVLDTPEGGQKFLATILTLDGTRGWEVYALADPGAEQETVAYLQTVASTFRILPAD